jgi:hypothetical protein
MMKKISEAELKKAILAVEARRAKHPPVFRPDHTQRAMLQKSRRESEKMVAAFLKQSGFDMKKFQALQEQRGAELDRMVAKHKADALRLASQRKDTLQSSIAGQAKALRDLAARKDFFPNPSFSLDKPFLIWSIPLQEISDSAAVPFGSWAKFKFSTSEHQGTQKFGFYFFWVNNFSDYAVINAATFMSATGFLHSHAPWGFWPSSSEVYAFAYLNLWLGWPTDFTSSNHAVAFLGGTGALSSVFTGPDNEGTSVSSGVSLNTTLFAVPPSGVVVFEVDLQLNYRDEGDGDITADFETGDFQIACPVVVFELLNSPSVLA